MTDTLEIPGSIMVRPWDVRRRLPVPFANQFPDGVHDYTVMNTSQVIRCANRRLCGICGTEVGYWIAFFGGEKGAASRSYNDPGMHIECVYASMGLCPYIVNQRMERATHGEDANLARSPQGQNSAQPGAWEGTHPKRWAMYITRNYKVKMERTKTGHVPIFHPAPAREIRYFVYNEAGKLTPES